MKQYILIVILFFFTVNSYANGGSIAKGGFVNGCNTIKLISEENFILESEDLYFHIEGDYINVMAIYLIKNLGEKKDIKYGFAIDYRDNPISKNYGWETDYISGFSICNNQTEIKYTTIDEKNIKTDSIYFNKQDVMTVIDTISRKWFISNLTFENSETKQLIVKYRVKTCFADWPMLSAYGDNYLSTPDSDRKFSYYLKPSGYWGNGNVGKFRLTISFDSIEKYSIFNINGVKDIKKENEVYVFECSNYNLLDNEFIKINYNYRVWEESLNSIRFANPIIVKDYKFSSEHPKYPASNLFDNNKNTTYVPLKKTEESDWIEINFKENVVLFGVGIINGFAKNNEVYLNNNIATKLRLTLKSKGENQAPIVREIQLTRKNITSDFNIYFIGISDLLMGEIYGDDNLSDNISSVISLKIEILETDKGAKYDDTCISELLLYGVIDKNR